MKNLKDYILEVQTETEKDTETQDQKQTVEDKHIVTFDFSGLEGAEDTIKAIEGAGCPCVEVDGDKVTVTASKEKCDKFDDAMNTIREYAETIRKSSKNASSESYAQTTKAFADKVADIDEYLEQVKGEEE